MFTQANIDDAVRNATILITPEDGVTQDDVDAVQTSLDNAIKTLREALLGEGATKKDQLTFQEDIAALATKIKQLNDAQSALTYFKRKCGLPLGEKL